MMEMALATSAQSMRAWVARGLRCMRDQGPLHRCAGDVRGSDSRVKRPEHIGTGLTPPPGREGRAAGRPPSADQFGDESAHAGVDVVADEAHAFGAVDAACR